MTSAKTIWENDTEDRKAGTVDIVQPVSMKHALVLTIRPGKLYLRGKDFGQAYR